MAKPLLMTCAEPPQVEARYTPGPGLAPDPSFSRLYDRVTTALQESTAAIKKCTTRINELEDQIGKIPPLLDRIAAMEKTIAKLPSLNPSIIKGLREHVDWTKVMSDEEDLLEEDYRGWPGEKKRTIF